jgi:hypothetical protein
MSIELYESIQIARLQNPKAEPVQDSVKLRPLP